VTNTAHCNGSVMGVADVLVMILCFYWIFRLLYLILSVNVTKKETNDHRTQQRFVKYYSYTLRHREVIFRPALEYFKRNTYILLTGSEISFLT
jgi:hypothetical protein